MLGAPGLASETWESDAAHLQGYDVGMAKGLMRFQQTGNMHFVTFSCHERNPYLRSAAARDLFEHSLETMRLRYDFGAVGYVVMPEHVHLLVNEPKKTTLATALQAVLPHQHRLREHRLDPAQGLAGSLFVFDQAESHMRVAVVAETDAGTDGYLRFG